jgi:hypothetical protein
VIGARKKFGVKVRMCAVLGVWRPTPRGSFFLRGPRLMAPFSHTRPAHIYLTEPSCSLVIVADDV